jgi:hypothetical protein
MIRTLTAVTAFIALVGVTLPALADCAGHETTVQTTTPPQTVVDSGTTPIAPVPTTPKTGG